ncbi:MAG: polysaccharide biosynthesis tyrosine autokinase [Candidatus Binataceae bacterium]|nr:polysaccharide biosynthesis tyrosine autokinase [Candidatus Binataceae bacterium]
MRNIPQENRKGLFLLGPEDETLSGHWLGNDQESASLGHFLLVLKRRRRLIAGFTLATVAITAVVVFFLLRPMYRASTDVLIERNAPQVLDAQEGLFSPDILDSQHDFYKTQEDLLGSQVLAAEVIRELDLGHNQAFLKPYLGGVPGWVADQIRLLYYKVFPVTKTPDSANPLHVDFGLIKRYQARLTIVPALNSRMMLISFLTPDPVLSARIADAHAQAYIREGLKLRTDPGEEAEQFLHEKLAEIEQKLRESEISLNNYRRQNGLIYLNDNDEESGQAAGGGHRTEAIQRLGDLSNLLAGAEADRIAQEAQAQLVQRHDYGALPAVVQSPLIQNLKEQLATLESQEASLASTYMPDHPKLMKAHAETEEVRTRLTHEMQNIATATQESYLAAQAKEQDLKDAIDKLTTTEMKLKDAGVEDAILSRQVETNRELYQGVLQRMKEMGMEAQLRASNVSVIDPAIPPIAPAIPKKALSLMLSVIVGLIGGVGLALTYEYLDNTLTTPGEVEAVLRLPNLTVVPDFATLARGEKLPPAIAQTNGAANGAGLVPTDSSDRLPTLSSRPLSAATEAYRTLCTNIVLSQPDRPPRTMVFTSTRQGEGKTVTILNTAVAFAQAGRRVLVIDADLRRAQCHRVLGVENGSGLTEVLTGQNDPAQLIRRVVDGQGKGGVWLLSAGLRPPNPGALIGSRRMQEVIEQVRDQFDHVLIDTCPLVPMSDAVILSTLVDGVVVVVRAGETPRTVVRDAVVHLTRARAWMIGVVLNRVDLKTSDYAHYFYRYYSPTYEVDSRPEA